MPYSIVIHFFLLLFTLNAYAEHNADSLSGKEPILPIPDIKISHPEEVELGNKLYHDTRLSENNTISCASCHPLNKAGVDGLSVAIGIEGRKGLRNTPSVFNSALNFRQFWDGRVKTLAEQAGKPITNPVEMNAHWPDVIKRLSHDQWYQKQFNSIYPDGITPDNIVHAIAEFERTLLTPDSPFDRYLKGDVTAINDKTKAGYRLFKSYGCSSCHQGAAVGGNMFEKLGVIKPYFVTDIMKADTGLYKQTGIDEDRFEFKVPSLRNVELTAPYLHDGSIPTLEKMVAIMGEYQLGRTIAQEDVDSIVLFLKSLTALPKKSLTALPQTSESQTPDIRQ